MYNINISIWNKSGDIILGKIQINHGDTYHTILNKINNVLQYHDILNITETIGFHYIQEDGDIAHINKDLSFRYGINDFIYSMQYDTTIYIYYNEFV